MLMFCFQFAVPLLPQLLLFPSLFLRFSTTAHVSPLWNCIVSEQQSGLTSSGYQLVASECTKHHGTPCHTTHPPIQPSSHLSIQQRSSKSPSHQATKLPSQRSMDPWIPLGCQARCWLLERHVKCSLIVGILIHRTTCTPLPLCECPHASVPVCLPQHRRVIWHVGIVRRKEGGGEVPCQTADDHVTAINWALTDSIHPGNRL